MKLVFGRALICSALLFCPVLSEVSLDQVTRVSQSVQGETLRLVIETQDRTPEVTAYFTAWPESLVVEVNDALPMARLGSKPSASIVKSWSIKQEGLNRSKLTLLLAQRPKHSEIKVSTSQNPPSVIVELPIESESKDKIALTDGVTWVREDTRMSGRWVRLNRLLFDPKDPNLEVLVGLAKENTNAREPLSSMVRRYDALAGINGGFFAGGGGALGLVYRDGKLLAPHVSRRPPRSGFGMTKARQVLFGRLAADGTAIKDLDGGDWTQAWLALGGGPRLLVNGATKITSDLEELGPKGNDITRIAARTVVGLSDGGQLMFATVTGYHDNHKEGTQFEPLVAWLKTLKIKDAVNFDGGSSVDMVIGSHIVSDGPANKSQEKAVATALLVRDKRKKLFCSSAEWQFGSRSLPADGESSVDLTVVLKTPSGEPVKDGTQVRFYAQGVGLEPAEPETKGGKVKLRVKSVRQPGKATIHMNAGPLTESESFRLEAGEVARLMVEAGKAKASKDTEAFQTLSVKVQTLDKWGNGVGRVPCSVSIDGGESVDFTTGQSGIEVLEVEASTRGGKLVVSHPSAGDKVFAVPPFEVQSVDTKKK